MLVEILRENKIDVLEEPVELTQLLNADEVWISSSTWEVVPVIELDNKTVGQGSVGPMWEKMNNLYQRYKASL